MDLLRILLVFILSFSLAKYQFQSAQNLVESVEQIYIGFIEESYVSYSQIIKETLQGNEFTKSLYTFVKNFDFNFFLNKILMARLEKYKVRREISQKNNFASLYGGASIIEKNEGSQNTKSILDDNTDKYMMNKCSTKNKYIVISLKEDININGFAIVNTEFYSSNVKDIVVYGSNAYPIEMKDWVNLGEFKLENIYEWQQFPLKTMWTRYVRIEFKSHFDDEYYCTITQIRVFGSPILADFKKDFMQQRRNTKTPTTSSTITTTSNSTAEEKDQNQSSTDINQSMNFNNFFEQGQTKWDVMKAMHLIQTGKQQCRNIDWTRIDEMYQCNEEDGRQIELEIEQQQSIFTILTMNISEIRQFIDKQVKSNNYFENQIQNYKGQLSRCNLDKKQFEELNRYQMSQIEDLRKMFYTAAIVGFVSLCVLLALYLCFNFKKQKVEIDNSHQFGRR